MRMRKQVKIMNNLMDTTNCPRSSNFSGRVVYRSHPPEDWPGNYRSIPRIPPKQQSHRISGFFQARLRMMKFSKQQRKLKKKGKLSSNTNKSVDNKIIACISRNPTSLINYQVTASSSSSSGGGGPILKRHRNMIRNSRRLSDLPDELLAEILVRLPVKYMLRCMCVLKSWNSLIKSPVFVTLQLNYQKQIVNANDNYDYPKYLFFRYRYSFGLTLRFDRVQCEEYCRLKFLPGYPDYPWFALSYNLICTSTILVTHGDKVYNRNIYLWNPLINKYKTLPDSPLPSKQNWEAWEALAFGFIPEVNDYVVIHIIKSCLPSHRHSVMIGVYSLNTNSWKKSSQDNVFISRISGNQDDVVFINGAAFWVGANSKKQKILMCFDTKTDVLSEISLPESVAFEPFLPVIHAFGQSIAYFIWEDGVIHFDMWVLKYDNINKFTWEKKMCVTPGKDVEEEVLGVRNNGDPILAKSKHLISYNLDSHQAIGFVDSWDRWTPSSPYMEGSGSPYVIRPFVESLVMLNND